MTRTHSSFPELKLNRMTKWTAFPPKMQRGTMYPARSQARADDNVPFRDLMAAIVDRQDHNAKYLQRLAEERKRGPLPGKGNGQLPQTRVNKQMVLDPSAKAQQVITEKHHSIPKLEQTAKRKKKEANRSYPDQEKSPYDKMEAVRSYARRREKVVTHGKSDQAVQGQKPTDLLDAVSIDSGCSSDKSTDTDMKRVERILKSVQLGRTRAAGCPKDTRAARRLHYVVAHGPSNAPQKKPKRDNMNRFYTPSLESKTLGHPRSTKSVPSSWEPHGELKVHPKYRNPSDGVCKYYCRNYPDYLREMQMERLLKKGVQHAAERSPEKEAGGALGCDLRELVKPSSPNKYNQDYSFACVNVKKPVRLPKLMDKVSGNADSSQYVSTHTGTDRRNNRKKDQAVMSSKIQTNGENGPRLPHSTCQYGSSDNVSGVPLRIPCPPQSTGLQKYFDRGTNEARIRPGYGAVTYTANPRATGYVSGGVISYRGGKETVYMLKELGEANPTRTLDNTAYDSLDRGLVSAATHQSNAPIGSSTGTAPAIVPVSRKAPGGDFCHQDVGDRSRWVGRIYRTENTVVQRQGNDKTHSTGQNDVDGQTSKTSDTEKVIWNVNSTDISVPNIDTPVVVTGPAVDDTDSKTVDSTIVAEQDIKNGKNNGITQSDGMASLLSVPMLHAERIKTLEEGFEGKDGDLSIPEIRMITATPLPPDYEA